MRAARLSFVAILKKMRFAGIACAIFTLGGAGFGAVPLGEVVKQARSEVRPREAMDVMRTVYSTDRWFTFPKFHQTAEYLKGALEAAGLKRAEIVETPADGVTQAGFWTMPLAWDVKRARLELLDSSAAENLRVLADYEAIPSSLGMWSGATPPGGIDADIVEVKNATAAAIAREDLRGKLVLTPVNPAGIKWLLVKAGALGAINAFTENPGLADGRQWINAWGDNGWAFTKASTPLLSFSISPRQAAYLRSLLAAGKRVRAHALVESRYYAGSYPYTTAVIPGSETDEEVLTLGHTSEQGAEDNATGVAGLVESLATLNRLIEAGKLPRPKRTIRILLMPEMYGTLDYVGRFPERVRHTVAAMCVDTPAALYGLAGTEYTFYLNPHVAKSYVDAFVLRVAQEYLPSVARPWHWGEYRSGTDAYLGEPTVGIPTTWPYSGSGVETHHNSEDTPDRVDERSLRDLAIMNAAYLYYIAAAGEPESYWLAAVAQRRGYEQIGAASGPFLDRLTAASNKNGIGRALAEGLDKMAYTVDRESQSVLSVLRLVAKDRQEEARGQIRPFVAGLAELGQQEDAMLRAAANRRWAELGGAGDVEPAPAPPDPQLAEARSIVVKRKRYGTIPLDELAPDEREGYPSGAWASVPTIALYWCDGRRNLADVIRLTRLELGPARFDFVGYFRFLQRHGYVDFAAGKQ